MVGWLDLHHKLQWWWYHRGANVSLELGGTGGGEGEGLTGVFLNVTEGPEEEQMDGDFWWPTS